MQSEKEIEKLYYSIGEVSDMLHINPSMLRYWEKEFEMLKLKRSAKGDRFFTKEDIEKVKLIHYLIKERGFTLDGARQQLKSKYEESQKKFLLVDKLQKIRAFLNELKEQL